MNRIHWSNKPIDVLKDREIDGPSKGVGKPSGLWYSFGNAWEKWCRIKHFHTEDLRYCYKVDVSEANILILNSVKEIKEFSDRYMVPITSSLATFIEGNNHHLSNWLGAPDWPQIAKEYDGLEIPRYFHNCRFEYLWFNGWDVASGVIWNASKAKINRLKGDER